MARPREFVHYVKDAAGRITVITDRDSAAYKMAKVADGLSLHSSGRFYTLDALGQRQYLGYLRNAQQVISRYLAADFEWVSFTPAEALEKPTITSGRQGSELAGPRLKTCLAAWQTLKKDEGIQDTYYADVTRAFDRFVSVVGNVPVTGLSADHFAAWRRWVIRNGQTKSAKWQNDQNKHVAAVLRAAKRDQPSWPFPAGLLEWLGVWESKPYLAPKKNRKRLTVDAFKALLTTADQWAQTDPERFSKTTQSGRAKRARARDKRVEGIRMNAIVRLAANCALDNIDCRTVQVRHLNNLDDELPYLGFPREKQRRQIGDAIERLTPLLPSTVKAIRRLMEIQPSPDFLFRTAHDEQYSEQGFENAVKKLFKAAGVTDFSFKHLRNIAPSLGKAYKRPRDERDAILGHVVGGTSKFYEDDVDEHYLIDLVNLTGREYFNGEMIAERKEQAA